LRDPLLRGLWLSRSIIVPVAFIAVLGTTQFSQLILLALYSQAKTTLALVFDNFFFADVSD